MNFELPRCRVLVLDGHSKAAAEVVLALPSSCDIHVAVSGESCPAFASRRVTHRLHQPSEVDVLRVWIKARDDEFGYSMIVASTETSLLAAKSNDLPSTLRDKFVLSDEYSIDIALDKFKTIEVARGLGIKVPQTTLVRTVSQRPSAPKFPVVVKPLHSKVESRGLINSFAARICADVAELDSAYAALLAQTPVVEQEYFCGRGMGVEALFDNGRLCWLFGHERIHELPIRGGASTYRRSIELFPAVRDAAVRILEHLRWHGVAMVEFKVDSSGDYRLIEINPRLWGSLPLAVAAGVNFPFGLLNLALGREVGKQPSYRRGQYCRDIVEDLTWYPLALRGRRDPLAVRKITFGDLFGLLRPLVGRERWDLFRWREPSIWLAATASTLRKYWVRLLGRLRKLLVYLASRRNWHRLSSAWKCGDLTHVVVLCHGNICRSPVVERVLARDVAGLQVVSAGFHDVKGRVSPAKWVSTVERTLAIDLSDHRSRTVDAPVLEWADLIILMDTKNWTMLAEMFPDHLRKAVLLGSTAPGVFRMGGELADPYGKDDLAMLDIARRLGASATKLIRQIVSSPPGTN